MDTIVAGICMLVAIHQAAMEKTVFKLGDDNFYVREAGSIFIEKQLNVPWEELLISWLCKDRNDLEITRRVALLTAKWDTALIEYGKYPWLDSLPKEYPDRDNIMKHYSEMAKARVACDMGWPEWRFATFLWMESIKKDRPISFLHAIQRNFMVPNELYYIQNNKYPW